MNYKEIFAEIIKDAFNNDLAEWYIDFYLTETQLCLQMNLRKNLEQI